MNRPWLNRGPGELLEVSLDDTYCLEQRKLSPLNWLGKDVLGDLFQRREIVKDLLVWENEEMLAQGGVLVREIQ